MWVSDPIAKLRRRRSRVMRDDGRARHCNDSSGSNVISIKCQIFFDRNLVLASIRMTVDDFGEEISLEGSSDEDDGVEGEKARQGRVKGLSGSVSFETLASRAASK